MIGEAIAFGNVLLAMNFAREGEIFGLWRFAVTSREMKAGKFRLWKTAAGKVSTFNGQLLGSGF
jgi:hypothetical protein